jgi:hypothetical protein
MNKPNTYTIDHQRDVWRQFYAAVLAGDHGSDMAFLLANEGLKYYIKRWPLA